MISTHILDLQLGQPAAGVTVLLEKQDGGRWSLVEDAHTNNDGRISFHCPGESGTYRLTFQIEEYFKKNKITPFFLSSQAIFQITETKRKYHIPLILSPFGYSTYRGS
jgi:5-hydroxyisourate hydrolase